MNLKWLNHFTKRKKFKMETWRTVMAALERGDFLTSLDLLEAYLHVLNLPSHRKFLQFTYGSSHYQYRALPFGLSAAPRVFTKLLVAIVASLRSQGVCIFPYLDDILIAASSYPQALEHLHLTMSSLQRHGFVINLLKSSLIPCQKTIHLGLLVDTFSFQLFLSPDPRVKIIDTLLLVREAPSVQLGTLTALLGLMVSCQDVIPWSQFHLRPLQSFLRPYAHLIETKASKTLMLSSWVKLSLK